VGRQRRPHLRNSRPNGEQSQHVEAASKDPALSLSRNHGYPAVAATAHVGLFKGPGVAAARADKPIEAPNVPAGNKATPVLGNLADYRQPPLPREMPIGSTTNTGLNERKSSQGAKPLERQNVKLIANAPQHTPPPPLPAALPKTEKLVGRALRPASLPSAPDPRPPTPQCPPGQQHC
jgi:hypothetical protein